MIIRRWMIHLLLGSVLLWPASALAAGNGGDSASNARMWKKGISPIFRNGPDQHSSVPGAAHKLDLSRSVVLFVGVHASACFSPPHSNSSVHISVPIITFHRHIHPRAGGSVPVGFRRLADSGTNRVYLHKQIVRQHSGSLLQVRLATCLLPKDRTPSLIASSPWACL